MLDLEFPQTPVAGQQSRWMPAADERILAVVSDLGDGGGDEVLVAEIGLDPAVDVLGDLREIGDVDGGSTEFAEDDGGGAHGRQALAPHVADEHPYRIRTSHDLVEIPADTGLGRSTDIAGREQERAEPARRRREYRALDHV